MATRVICSLLSLRPVPPVFPPVFPRQIVNVHRNIYASREKIALNVCRRYFGTDADSEAFEAKITALAEMVGSGIEDIRKNALRDMIKHIQKNKKWDIVLPLLHQNGFFDKLHALFRDPSKEIRNQACLSVALLTSEEHESKIELHESIFISARGNSSINC